MIGELLFLLFSKARHDNLNENSLKTLFTWPTHTLKSSWGVTL